MTSPFNLLQPILQQPYSRDEWLAAVQDLFPDGSVTLLRQPEPLQTEADDAQVRNAWQLGSVRLADGNAIALLEIEAVDQVLLARNRVGLRNAVAGYIDQSRATAVLATFYQPQSADWRLTYASRRSTIDEDTFEITTVETAPRRFTFLLGANEPCRTAAGRLGLLKEKGAELTLADVENAFSVERLSKEFFKKYKEHYQAFIDYLLSDGVAADTRSRFGIHTLPDAKDQDRADKPVRDFVKTLLGRLVFLHFLQKKRWLGCPAGTAAWVGGQPDFVARYFALAQELGEGARFHSGYLCPLFFQALNTPDRTGDIFPVTGTRLPYLNGGLFEDDPSEHQAIDLPEQLFAALLGFFGEYNFTIDENDPEDHEVGIDPEMLGHIFENLLEDNKDKGTFYTPKAIVAYMARQSLLHYLQTHLGDDPDLVLLLNEKDHTNHPRDSFVARNAHRIAGLLENVRICDPAIGSGAFPMGVLHEILWTRLALNLELNAPAERARLKRRIIQHTIHGVDIDPGAIEIARLRFWLALVVDEEEPRPLPNLDYKIHRADSLVAYIRGEPVDLGVAPPTDPHGKRAVAQLIDAKERLFTAQRAPDKRNAWLDLYRALAQLGQMEFTWLRTEQGLFSDDAEKVVALDHGIHEFGGWIKRIDAVRKYRVGPQDDLLAELRTWFDDLDKPTFLWNLHFGEVFAAGGFDIVIANPPYVRHETISAYAPLLRARYDVAASRADLYIFFYEQAIKLLRPDTGVLAFITSNKYFRAAYGKKLRPFLKRNLMIRTIIDFGDAPVFDAIAYASILLGDKREPDQGHEMHCYHWRPDDSLGRITEIVSTRGFPVRQAQLAADGWQLERPEVVALLKKLREKGTPLSEYVGGKFYYGIKTGLNDAFVISAEKRDELIAADPRSAALIKPFLRGKDVKRWQATHRDLYLIVFPYGFHKKLRDYPAILEHVEGFEERLKNRGQCKSSRGGKEGGQHHWLELDNNPKPEYLNAFLAPKLILGRFMNKPLYAYDDTGLYHNNALSFAPVDSPSTVACLNSCVTWWFLSSTCTMLQNGYIQAQNADNGAIPIPPAAGREQSRLSQLAIKCAEAASNGDSCSLTAYEAEIDQIVYRLFELTDAEIRLIERMVDMSGAEGTARS